MAKRGRHKKLTVAGAHLGMKHKGHKGKAPEARGQKALTWEPSRQQYRKHHRRAKGALLNRALPPRRSSSPCLAS